MSNSQRQKKDYRLSNDERAQYTAQLKELTATQSSEYQFTDKQIKQLLDGKSRKISIDVLLNKYHILINEPYNFNASQLTNIAKNEGGSINLEFIQIYFERLKNKNLNSKQITSLASHKGGSKNLVAVHDNFIDLQKKGFSIEQIVGIANRGGGAKNVEIIISKFKDLQKLGFNINQMARIASHSGGSKNIEAVLEYCNHLRDLNFNHDDITKIASTNYDVHNSFINIIQQHYEQLGESNFIHSENTNTSPNTEPEKKNVTIEKENLGELEVLESKHL